MDRIDTLHEKLDTLLRNYKATRTELASARTVLKAKEEEVSTLQARLAKCEEQLLAMQIGNAMPDAESRHNSRKQLDAVIGEIDKILGTLND